MADTHKILDVSDPLYELARLRAVLTAALDRQLLLASRQTTRNQRWSDQIVPSATPRMSNIARPARYLDRTRGSAR